LKMPSGKMRTVMHPIDLDYRGLRLNFMLKMNNHMNLGCFPR
jgi:hypothetical protein